MKRQRLPVVGDRGAVMLICVFFAVFAVSILYLAVGAAETVLYRERLQDAADSAALSGAITHARIMNVLVLINMVMVTLLAILVTLKLIQGVAIIGIAIAAGLAWFTAGTSLAAIPPLKSLETSVSDIYDSVEPIVFSALETLHDVGDQIAEAAPQAAEEVARGIIESQPRGIIEKGFAASTAESLPVANDTYEGLCGRAGGLALTIANIPLTPLPGWSSISSELDGPMHSLSASLSEWFCGDGQNSVPDLSQDVPIGSPKTQKATDCEQSSPSNATFGQEKTSTTKECEEAASERIAATPDSSGNCQTNCEPGGPYDLAVMSAREMCDPSISPKAKKYLFQVQEGTVEYSWNGRAWIRGEPRFRSSIVNDEPIDRLPCMASGLTMSVKRDVDGNVCGRLTAEGYLLGYNKAVHPVSDPKRVLPACTNECAPKNPPPKTESGPVRTVKFKQVSQVFGCVRTERKAVDVGLKQESPNGTAKKGGNPKSPKGLAEGVTLGGEPLQIRAIVIGSTKQRESARLVRLGQWGKPDPTNPLERMKELGGFATAQAEYFYDENDAADAWMWNMNWRGRLKRFELPNDNAQSQTLNDICLHHELGSDCERILSLASEWRDLIFH